MQLAFGSGILYGVATADATGAAVANATPVQFGTLQDISADISFEEKLLYGSYQMPIAVGRGKGKLAFKAKMAVINGSILGDLFFGQTPTNSIKAALNNFSASVPATTPFTITPAIPGSGTFVSDLGVLDATTGLALKKVASAPTTGQYSVSAGVYTFASADASRAVYVSLEYSATSTSAKVITLTNQLMGYAPTFKAMLSLSYGGKALNMVMNQCISSKFSMPFKNDDFSIPEFDFSAFADGAGNIGYISTAE